MTPQRIEELIGVYRDGLLEDTLGFWFPRCVDGEHGGYLIARDRDGSLVDDDKSTWQQCRTGVTRRVYCLSSMKFKLGWDALGHSLPTNSTRLSLTL